MDDRHSDFCPYRGPYGGQCDAYGACDLCEHGKQYAKMAAEIQALKLRCDRAQAKARILKRKICRTTLSAQKNLKRTK